MRQSKSLDIEFHEQVKFLRCASLVYRVLPVLASAIQLKNRNAKVVVEYKDVEYTIIGITQAYFKSHELQIKVRYTAKRFPSPGQNPTINKTTKKMAAYGSQLAPQL